MDPDQWFRLWLALGQGVIGGAVTLGGGYLGYRLAGRADRERRRAEVLADLDEQIAHLADSVRADYKTNELTYGQVFAQAADTWALTRERLFARSGSPASILATEVSLAVADAASAYEDNDGSIDDMDFVDGLLGDLHRAREECRRWRVDGPPGRWRLRARWRRAMAESEVTARRQGKAAAEAISRWLNDAPTDEGRTP